MSNESNDAKQLERKLSEALTEGDMQGEEEQAEATRKRLLHRYEYRIQVSSDPIVEETERYREMAREVDGRYDAYMERTKKKDDT